MNIITIITIDRRVSQHKESELASFAVI